jgi:hypothetical protein
LLQLLWEIFSKTGQINNYMFYKALENTDLEYKLTNASDSPSIDITESYPECQKRINSQDRLGNEFTC